jgi:pyruvate,water dikinase
MTVTAVKEEFVIWFENLGIKDRPQAGGKNASLGEMISTLSEKGIKVPEGFAVSADAYRFFLEKSGLSKEITELMSRFDQGKIPLSKAGAAVRRLILKASFPTDIQESILHSYRELGVRLKIKDPAVAVRSSATAEDLPDASFAGQQETFLNVQGENSLMEACLRCYASLFTDRAISYRKDKGFDHMKVALSVGVQRMVRSDKGVAGVMFTLDTESGFPQVVLINASWGLGENVVQGAVDPDEYLVFKPLLNRPELKPIIERTLGRKEKKMIYTPGSKRTKNTATSAHERDSLVLTDAEILQLARWACVVEDHYGKPMDMEWAKDGETGEIFIVQARPETVQSRKAVRQIKTFRLKGKGKKLVEGLSIGEAIASGKVCRILKPSQVDLFPEGGILVAEATDPDWVPLMKKAKGIITDHGGRTCHAAIVSRELGIPAVVGTGNATQVIKTGQEVTVVCAGGAQGLVYEGLLDYEEKDFDLEELPPTHTGIFMNIASPEAAFEWWHLPVDGVGLARMEFIINNIIRMHPMALVSFKTLKDKKVRKAILKITRGWKEPVEYFVDKLAEGIAQIAATRYPKPVILRMSDFKTNEYAQLIGGAAFEPKEENPMLGFRGASRYYDPRYQEGFALECRAVKKVRNEMGLDNVIVMIPFCRTPKEADRVLAVMAENGLKRGEKGLQVYVMCEIPSNVLRAKEFAERFDGFSIGSNDLTQLTLGVDRDAGDLSALFDERDEAVKILIRQVIQEAHKAGVKVGICGQAPSDYPDFTEFLVEAGIDTISLNPDSVLTAKKTVAQAESKFHPKT